MAKRVVDLRNKGEIEKFKVEVDSRSRRVIQFTAMGFQERLEPRTPERTGALRKGWGNRMKRDGFEIYNTKDYAEYVEYGTEKMAPRRMLQLTVLEMDQIVAEAIEKANKK